ncbi:MAG: hypothetical protein AAFX55_12915 [Bacteroidota bacterium]
MQTNQPYNPKSIIKTMTILHYAYAIAILGFGVVTLIITDDAYLNFNATEDMFFYLVPLLAIGGLLGGNYAFNTNLKSIRQKPTLKEKLSSYQSIRLIRLAFLEGPALLGIVGFMITSNQLYLIIAAVLLTYIIFLRPTRSVIREDLDLNAEQDRELREALR